MIGKCSRADDLARGFAWLRPNDLTWNCLLGADPPAFDVLDWTSDATHLSASLMGDFLTLFETQAFTGQGEVEMAGHKIDLLRVKSDISVLGGVTDHIMPWKATYRSTELFGANDVTYVLSRSGHMQAILNPPGNPKARYFIQVKNEKLPATADEWLEGAEEIADSWWPYWMKWVQKRSGELRAFPKELGNSDYKPLDPTPGLYVVEKR